MEIDRKYAINKKKLTKKEVQDILLTNPFPDSELSKLFEWTWASGYVQKNKLLALAGVLTNQGDENYIGKPILGPTISKSNFSRRHTRIYFNISPDICIFILIRKPSQCENVQVSIREVIF